jgi:hypothetical protein
LAVIITGSYFIVKIGNHFNIFNRNPSSNINITINTDSIND